MGNKKTRQSLREAREAANPVKSDDMKDLPYKAVMGGKPVLESLKLSSNKRFDGKF